LNTTAIIIDDEPDILESFSEYLSVLGIDILAVGKNGKEAVEQYKKFKPDVVLLDAKMPDYDGIYGLRSILEYDKDAKVIIVTASVSVGTEKILLDSGAAALVWKPFDGKNLLNIIEEVKNGAAQIIPLRNG